MVHFNRFLQLPLNKTFHDAYIGYLKVMYNIELDFLITAHPKMQKITYIAHINMQHGTITRKIGSIGTTNTF